MKFLDLKTAFSQHERAKYICLLASFFAALYHFSVLIVFGLLKLRFLFFYNFFSVALFTTLTVLIPKFKKYLPAYILGSIEVIIHQVIGNYILGSLACFHFFILLFALLPFLIFEENRWIAFPCSAFNAIVFIFLEVYKFPPAIDIPNLDLIVIIFRGVNVSLATGVIVAITLVYSTLTFRTEKSLNSHNEKLNSEINLAAKIQQNFLPQVGFEDFDWELSFYNNPMAGVSGDVYDIFHENQKLQGFNLSDVSGHGISSGMITMLVNNIIHKEFYRFPDVELEDITDRINNKLIHEKGEIHHYLTGILVKTGENGHIDLLNAGHPYPIIYRKEQNSYEILERREDAYGPIGIKDLPVVFKSQFVDMKSGDELILYTDGISEAVNKDKKQYGIVRLAEKITESSDASLYNQIQYVLSDLNVFTNNAEQDDDITIMILKKK